nr:hypothetical protein MFMH1_09490 [Myxococcus sp. MH1]
MCLTNVDVKALESVLRTGEDFRVINGLAEKPEIIEAEGALADQERMVFLARAVDLREVRFQPVPGKSLYRVDSIDSPVVEFSPCRVSNSVIRPGRLFFKTRYYEGERGVDKSPGFLTWSAWLMARCRKELMADSATRTYWGRDAASLRDASQLTLEFL